MAVDAMMEFKLWSRRQRKRSERNAHRIVGRANLNRCLTSKDLQEDLAESGVVEHCSAVQQHLHIYDLHERVNRRKSLWHLQHKIQHQNFAKEYLNKPDAFWKQVLWTDEVRIEVFGHMSQGVFGEQGCRIN